jgi:hypothetical protein
MTGSRLPRVECTSLNRLLGRLRTLVRLPKILAMVGSMRELRDTRDESDGS